MELFFDQKSEWAQRAMGQKASRALVQKLEFEPCFVLHPVAIRKGFVTVDEFALFCVATHAILDKSVDDELTCDYLCNSSIEGLCTRES